MKNYTEANHKSSYALVLLCSYAFIFLCSSIPVRAEALQATAGLIPPETILLVDIDNFIQLKTQFEKTNFYKLYKDPAMAAFVEDFKTKWRDKIRQKDNEFITIFSDPNVLPQGKVALVLVLNEQTKDANEPPFLFISQWGENANKIKENIDKMVQKAVEEGAHRTTEEYRDVSITSVIKTPSKTVSFCFIDDCVIVSMNLDILKFVVAHIKGAASPTLANDADYTSTMKTIGPHHDIDFYVNVKHIIKTAIAEDTAGQAKNTISNLGLDNVTSMGCSIALARDPGISYCGKALLKIEGEKKGICKMLNVESAAFTTPKFISTAACSTAFINLNIKKVYQELYNILYNFDPQKAAFMLTPLLPPSPDGQPGLELKADIIEHLGSQIIIAQSIKKPITTTTGQQPAESLVAIQITNRSALEKSLSLLHSKRIAPNNPDARREILGHTIYLLDLPGMLPILSPGKPTPLQAPDESAEGGLPQIPKAAFTVTDTHLLFGFESTIEQAIRNLNSPQAPELSSATWFNKAKSAIPSVVGLASLQDNTASGELLWKMLKESKKYSEDKGEDSTITMGAGAGSSSLLPYFTLQQAGSKSFNFTLLPDFDTVRKYFGLSASYGISSPDGFFFEFKYLNPDSKTDNYNK